MFNKYVFAFAVVILVTATANPLQSVVSKLNLIDLEEPCTRQGGLCLPIEDCDPGNLVHVRGVLCPEQRHLGVECCYM